MFVVFEGIDGSGKTTISNRVAQRLRNRGLTVEHVREGGRFASAVTQGIREFCRDSRNLALSPRAELYLYAAREIQLLDEAVQPALARADVVIADRFLYTAEVLARFGRGIDEATVRGVIDAAAQGAPPDLVFLIDVDPSVARGRRKITKILTPDPRPPSRKGLTGSGLQQRLRDGYLQLAHAAPNRWIIVDNTDDDLDRLVQRIAETIGTGRTAGIAAAISEGQQITARPVARSVAAPPQSAKEALQAFLAWVDHRAKNEPDLAAYVLAGLGGQGIDQRRLDLAVTAPRVLARGLKGLTDAVSWQLRRILLEAAPRDVALSLMDIAVQTPESWRLRHWLAPIATYEVAHSLQGLDDDQAWALRVQLYARVPDAVVSSLALLGSPPAWTLRASWLSQRGLDSSAGWPADSDAARITARSVTGLDDDRAWKLRRAARDSAPIAAITSLAGTNSERSWRWRQRYLSRAPKAVLSTLAGVDDARAWAMRAAMAPICREALDSMTGMDHPTAWEIRDACLAIWPANVIKSLGPLVTGDRGDEMLRNALGASPGNISLLKHAAAIATGAHLTPAVLAA